MKKAPDFALKDQDNTIKRLKDYAGKWVVLYFYPKDDTPGCTTEACNFRDAREFIASIGNCDVIGINADSVESHKKFALKHNLNFTLLSDPEHGVIESYDSWKPKKMFGKEFLGVLRNTFIIDPAGNMVKTYEGVSASDHATEIIRDLRLLQN